jgi:hypothetical protein
LLCLNDSDIVIEDDPVIVHRQLGTHNQDCDPTGYAKAIVLAYDRRQLGMKTVSDIVDNRETTLGNIHILRNNTIYKRGLQHTSKYD